MLEDGKDRAAPWSSIGGDVEKEGGERLQAEVNILAFDGGNEVSLIVVIESIEGSIEVYRRVDDQVEMWHLGRSNRFRKSTFDALFMAFNAEQNLLFGD